jgi:hypothetical protein
MGPLLIMCTATTFVDPATAEVLVDGAGGQTRTGTARENRGILSPLRLPFRHAR